MRCLYCGKHLALFRKLTGGGEFCSDAHRDKYQEEYNRLAVSRLLQAQSRPDEVKPSKKKAAAAPPVAARGGASNPSRGSTAVAVEAEEAEIEVVAVSTEYFHQRVSPVVSALEQMPIECEPVLCLNSPEVAPVPEVARPVLEPAALRLHAEAGFLTLCPQPQRAGLEPLENASPLTVEAALSFPSRPHSQLVEPALAEAAAITQDSLPASRVHAFEPLASGVVALEFDGPAPVAATTSFSPVTNDLSTASPIGLTLVSMVPEAGALEFETSLPFQYAPRPHPAFDSGLKLLDFEMESSAEPTPVEPPRQVVNGIAGAGPVLELSQELTLELTPESTPEPIPDLTSELAPELTMVTPRRVLEVLSKMHGDGREPTSNGPEPAAAPAQPAHEEPPAALLTLKSLTIPALAPSPAALTAGFPAMIIGIEPRLLPYIPLPLRPKMAIGNALGPRPARNGVPRNGGGRKGSSDSPKNMPRSMLHLEDRESTASDSEVESPTLFGKLGGLFGKKQKNH